MAAAIFIFLSQPSASSSPSPDLFSQLPPLIPLTGSLFPVPPASLSPQLPPLIPLKKSRLIFPVKASDSRGVPLATTNAVLQCCQRRDGLPSHETRSSAVAQQVTAVCKWLHCLTAVPVGPPPPALSQSQTRPTQLYIYAQYPSTPVLFSPPVNRPSDRGTLMGLNRPVS